MNHKYIGTVNWYKAKLCCGNDSVWRTADGWGWGGDSLLGWPRVEQLEQGHRQRPAGHTLYTNTNLHLHLHIISSTCICNQQEMTCSRLQTNVNVCTSTGDTIKGTDALLVKIGISSNISCELCEMVAWITMHLDTLDWLIRNKEEVHIALYCHVSRVTSHVTRDQPRVFVVFN